ncbi:ubiquinol-cytochrome C reductase hinge domain-containing protein [Mrakia frigida]|uniref:cytochrome b-c1 complex subunit 6 family protein n=1 Tax=Mrakia frigida TaxID=29902 RepID=UPI003FCC0196
MSSSAASTSTAPAAEEQSSSQGFFASLLEAVMPTAHAESTEVASTEDAEGKEEEAPAAEEEEEEEPEDIYPSIREECAATAACAPAKTHFEHCEKKVRDGKGWEGEDCVEELFHLMHCVDTCAIPQLWKKLA